MQESTTNRDLLWQSSALKVIFFNVDLPKWEFIFLVTIYVTEMWTTATSVPKRGCPLLVLDKVLRSEDSETFAGVCKSSPNKRKGRQKS